MMKLLCKIFGHKASDFEVVEVYKSMNKKKVIKNNLIISKVCKRCGDVIDFEVKYDLRMKDIVDEITLF